MSPTTRQALALAAVSAVAAFVGAISPGLACTPTQRETAVEILGGPDASTSSSSGSTGDEPSASFPPDAGA